MLHTQKGLHDLSTTQNNNTYSLEEILWSWGGATCKILSLCTLVSYAWTPDLSWVALHEITIDVRMWLQLTLISVQAVFEFPYPGCSSNASGSPVWFRRVDLAPSHSQQAGWPLWHIYHIASIYRCITNQHILCIHLKEMDTSIVLYCIVLHCIALHCIALHCIALHCIALHCIALHCIALHCIVLIQIPTGPDDWTIHINNKITV